MMDRWRITYEEYRALPIAVAADMVLLMELEGEVAQKRAEKDAT